MKKTILFLLLVILAGYTSAQDKTTETQVKIEKPIDAEFPGGDEAWKAYLNKSLRKYEKKIRKEGLGGTVYLIFTIDEKGNVIKPGVLSCKDAGLPDCLPPTSELAIAGMEIVSNSPQWKPATLNGKPVKAFRRQPLSFRLQ
jgi:protein TonB